MWHPGGASDASPGQNSDPPGGMHIFPRENRIPLGEVARNFEKNHEFYHFQVWRRKSGHVVRSRGHTCEKHSPWGKKYLLSLFGSNAAIQLWVEVNEYLRDSPSYFAKEQEFCAKLLQKCYRERPQAKIWYDTQKIVRPTRGGTNQNLQRLNSRAACVLSKKS